MKSLKIAALGLALVLFAASVNSVSAQGPMRKMIYFTINHPFEMSTSHIVLPEGKYILHQVDNNDSNLFALYRNDLMHSPIAMVRTTRIDYTVKGFPGKDKMLVNLDEEATATMPIINGWNIAGMDGWEILAVVPNKDRLTEDNIAFVKNEFRQPKRHKDRLVVIMTTSGY